MSENPFAQSSPMGSGMNDFAEPERTSLLAVGSLICSLTCCLAPLGVLMGIGALVGISGSRGRVGGKGLALVGTLLGLIVSAILIGSFIGFNQMMKVFINEAMPNAAAVVRFTDEQDYQSVRSVLVPPADALATDARIDAFRDEYRDTLGLGAFVGTPADLGIGELFSEYLRYGQVFAQYQGRNDIMPVLAQFEHGEALVMILFDQTAMQRGSPHNPIPVKNVIVILEDGTSVSMFDPVMLEAARNGRLDELFPGTETVPADQLPGAAGALPSGADADAAGDAIEGAVDQTADEIGDEAGDALGDTPEGEDDGG